VKALRGLRPIFIGAGLIVVGLAVANLPTLQVKAQDQPTSKSYTWTVTCNGAVVGSGITWNWQLANGSTMGGGFAACIAPFNSGTGTIPPTTTGITVTAGITGSPAVCGDFETVTKSVSASQNLSVNIRLSFPSTVTFFGSKVDCLPGSAEFKLSS